MTNQPPPLASTPYNLPMADLAYAPASERLAARPVLAIVMAVPAAAIVYDFTLLAIFFYHQFAASGGSFGGSFMSRSVPGLLTSALRIVAGIVVILTAAAGWRGRRVGPTAIVCLIYAIAVVVLGLATFALDWIQIGGRSGMETYVIQRTVTSMTPGIVPLVCSIMLRRLASAWGERG